MEDRPVLEVPKRVLMDMDFSGGGLPPPVPIEKLAAMKVLFGGFFFFIPFAQPCESTPYSQVLSDGD
jgi:hypothetical protein